MERTKPPKEIPANLLSRYTMNGKVKIEYRYLDNSYPPEKPLVYKGESVDSYMELIKQKRKFYYGITDRLLYKALEKYGIDGKDVAIMGSIAPLYESICLFYGGKPTIIEYNKIISNDNRLRVMTVEDYDKNPLTFDAAFSISAFEHDGLGRYGDPLNPDGDLDAMKKMKSILKPNGLLFLAVPIGNDTLVWNAHRVYGKTRLGKLLEGWKLLDIFSSKIFFAEQPILVLQNSESGAGDCDYNGLFNNVSVKLALSKVLSAVGNMKNLVWTKSRDLF
jgi:SAM-dependent methyltransferase